MVDFATLFSLDSLSLLGKFVMLLLIALYFLFSLLIFFQVLSLNRILTITDSGISIILRLLFAIHLFLVAFLFFFALAIL